MTRRLIVIGIFFNAALIGLRAWQEAAAQQQPTPAGNGDVNGDGVRDITDATYLLNWLFLDGPRPVAIAQDADAFTPEHAAILATMSLDGDTLRIEGVNVQIVSGEGSSETTNGRGNLIIGYNEPNEPVTPEGRMGSHNLVLGKGQVYTSYGAIVAGHDNESLAPYASVLGGGGNRARGESSTVFAGIDNQTLEDALGSVIITGSHHRATARYSCISGGARNTASGPFSSISGGKDNTASGATSSISGGKDNTASGENSSISGGLGNTASGDSSSISGGWENTASSLTSSVNGGRGNFARGVSSTVSGGGGEVEGDGNGALARFSTVTGGRGVSTQREAEVAP